MYGRALRVETRDDEWRDVAPKKSYNKHNSMKSSVEFGKLSPQIETLRREGFADPMEVKG